ncbi:hypothetical protein P3T35_005405 [Kitasatospora sp. GP30]|uniref:hypothetical protein n=1 Tax=Kitasatospora sp. GP30 TaxID=3035084 RepID=UPI000C7150E7|nr:hypothetical protein [Kitasatospora sp. GP30]MDH6143371.1 hypothetical protein [Kitasatospora sp. GP30]
MPTPTGAIPPRLKRVHLQGLPSGVAVLSIPGVGTDWYRRGGRYWAARAALVVIMAALAGVQCLFYKLILADDPHTTRFGAEWWAVAAFGLLATVEGFRVAFLSRAFPFAELRRRQPKPVQNLLALPALVYLVSVLFLAPGMSLAAAVESLRPVPWDERIARADLDAQLRARKAGTSALREYRKTADARMPASLAETEDPGGYRFLPRRVHLAEHPAGVTVQSVPFLGVSWYRRGVRYRLGRAGYLAVGGLMAFVTAGAWWDGLGGRLDAHAWWILAVSLLGTVEGLRLLLFKQSSLSRLAGNRRKPLRGLFVILVVPYAFLIAVTPGIYLAAVIDALCPAVLLERAARADLEEQLRVRQLS